MYIPADYFTMKMYVLSLKKERNVQELYPIAVDSLRINIHFARNTNGQTMQK